MVFKIPAGTAPPSSADVMTLYSGSGALNEGDGSVMTDFAAAGSIYKSGWLDDWGTNLTVSAVSACRAGNLSTKYKIFAWQPFSLGLY